MNVDIRDDGKNCRMENLNLRFMSRSLFTELKFARIMTFRVGEVETAKPQIFIIFFLWKFSFEVFLCEKLKIV